MTIRNIIFAAAGSSLAYEPLAYLKSQTNALGGWGGTVSSDSTWPRNVAIQKTTSYDASVATANRGIWAIQQQYPNSGQYLGVVGRWYNLPNGYWRFNASEAKAKGDTMSPLVPSTATITGFSVSNFHDAFVLQDTTDASLGGTRVIVSPPTGNYTVLTAPTAPNKYNWGTQVVISPDGQWIYVNNSTSGAGQSHLYAYKANNVSTASTNAYNFIGTFGQPSGTGFGAYALKTNALGSVITAWGYSPTFTTTEAQHIWKRSGNTFTQYQILISDSSASRPVWGRVGDGTALSGDGQYFAVVSSNVWSSGDPVFVTIFKDGGTNFAHNTMLAFPGVAGTSNFSAYSIDFNYDGSVLALLNAIKNSISVYRRVGTTWSLSGDYRLSSPYTTFGGGVRLNNDGTLLTAQVSGGGSSAIALWAL